ncbi:MAG: tyrosine-type recombinase/integrase [Solirubrobacteraceae bacterium]
MAPAPAFAELVDDFLDSLRAAKRSEHTLTGYRNDLYGIAGRIVAPTAPPGANHDELVAGLTIDQLDHRALRRGFGSWAADHAAGSIVRAWTVWNRFFTHLVDDERAERNPMKSVPKPKLPKEAPRSIRHESPAELLLATAAIVDPRAKLTKRWPERDVALIATFCVTGIRLAEAVSLNLDSITGPAGARRLQLTGKGRKDRAIPVQQGLESVIDRYLETRVARHGAEALGDPASPLLVHYDGSRLTPARIQYVVEQLYKRAGIRQAVPTGALVHALRHSFASLAVEYGADVVELRDLLGHSSLATTSRYLDANANRLREAVAGHPSQRAVNSLR